MSDIIAFFQEHWDSVLAVYGALVVIATVITKFTPTKKDDKVLNWIVTFFDQFSTENPKGKRVVDDRK